ncbi:BspA family leucine-rich repeat surface protein [Spiroplasma endosymbiont of Lasioglossum malachurum]|uniref:BspA family leucine-rich repeat surface protein n=1 Tax=Spiroplasma endosymbiont of Lasioglossum malachurum TaxID=3066319 RepID=UPI0030CFB7DF
MKTLIKTLSILILTTTTGNLTSFLNTIKQNTNITTNYIQNKTQQDTIYKDKNGIQKTTNDKDLSDIESKEIVQIRFFENGIREIQAVKMPKIVEKVPDQLPTKITSLSNMFANNLTFDQNIASWNISNIVDMSYMFYDAKKFNQDISGWDVSNVTNMMGMFWNAKKFNQNLSAWNVKNVINFDLFATNSGIDSRSKWPKFKYHFF